MTAEIFVQPTDWILSPDVLVRTETGGRLHIAACPHIGGGIRLADAAERLAMEVCSWCRKELDGVGRRYFDNLEDAMRAFRTYAGTEQLIRDALRFTTHDQIWLPPSSSYVALGHEGRGVAWFGKTWIVPASGVWQELPGYHAGSGGGAQAEALLGEICPVHHVARALTGACDLCD